MKNLKKMMMMALVALSMTSFVGCSDDDKDEVVPEPEFSWDYKEGFFVTKPSGTTDEIKGSGDKVLSVDFYKESKSLVVNNFKPAAMMPVQDILVITGVTVKEVNGKTTFSAETLTTKGMFAGTVVNKIEGEIIDGKAMFSMEVMMAMGGAPSAYACKYFGDINVEQGSYTAPE